MRVRSERSYRFAIPASELWARINDLHEYRRWWPWLRRFEARSLEPGETWSCTIQPPLPYTLRFRLSLDEVIEERLVAATLHGDIVGTARLELLADGTGCEARLRSDLAPGNRYLQRVARVAEPVVRFGHDWVLDTGARQFRRRAV